MRRCACASAESFSSLSSSSMESLLKSSFPIFTSNPTLHTLRASASASPSTSRESIRPPPPDFDFRREIQADSRARIFQTHPELLDLADNGALVLIEKRQYGPVPPWRSEFVEPEAIWLVGTFHISDRSATDVERVIRSVVPDNVVVELCRSRAGIMYSSNGGDASQQEVRSSMFSLSGTGFFGAVGRSINLGGQTALALRLLLAVFSSKISNRPFGDEFRAARKVAEEIGAQIVLGDRPIEITLERAWNCLNLDEKIHLVFSVFRGLASQSDIAENNLKESSTKDATLELYGQLSYSYPALLQPLIHERDTYLAWSLKRSKAVNNSKRVVGIIGRGHMNGVVYSLISDQGNLRFRDLTGKRPDDDGSNRLVTDLAKSLARDTLIGIVLWALYELVKGGL
ncbi:traB domain-containing protein [Punica granatum]|uniref:TraB domain-containing protein n=1 Tax=Punica granatum TaxID=22663 RepID=A0A6P8CFY1_PUNGR|nr:traB domain-containing protein [Punica granatum]